jgi:hypothetical protein
MYHVFFNGLVFFCVFSVDGCEHREDLAEESHQVKHWLLEHLELEAPPKFKFTIISSFGDPLTRQLSESVRIEKRGINILNSKSEYSRCRVPRLRVDMEEWKTKRASQSQGKTSLQEEQNEEIIKDLEIIEEGVRRKESKRKGDPEVGSKRSSKRRKFARLTNWGEAEEVSSLGEEWGLKSIGGSFQPGSRVGSFDKEVQILERKAKSGASPATMKSSGGSFQPGGRVGSFDKEVQILERKAKSGASPATMNSEKLDEENSKMMSKPALRKRVISTEVRKKKFEFKKRGKLNKDEEKEMRRTHNNIFDWVKKSSAKQPEEMFETMIDADDDWLEKEMHEREARLDRVAAKYRAWEMDKICKDILKEVLERVDKFRVEVEIGEWLGEVIGNVVAEGQIRSILREVDAIGTGFRNILEVRLRQQRLEERKAMEIMLEEDEKDQRMSRKEQRQRRWLEKRRWLEADKLSEQFRKLEIRDQDWMEVDTWEEKEMLEDMEVNENVDDLVSRMTSRGALKSKLRFRRRYARVIRNVSELGRLGECVEVSSLEAEWGILADLTGTAVQLGIAEHTEMF